MNWNDWNWCLCSQTDEVKIMKQAIVNTALQLLIYLNENELL